MSDCKVKISVDICGESALDKVTKLVTGYIDDKGVTCNPLQLKTACKQVAEEFNNSNEGAHVKWQTLRQSYYRAQKVGVTCNPPKVEKPGQCPEKESTPLEVPMFVEENDDLKNNIDKLLQEIEQLKQELKKLESINIMLSSVVDEYVEKEKQWLNVKEEKIVDKGALKREIAFEFIQKHGSALQVKAITIQNPDNERLYSLFDKVRQDYLQHSPPQSLTSDILDATHIIL